MVQEQCDILFARIEFPRYFRDPRFWKRSMRRKIHTNANGRSQNSCEPGGPVAPITNERVPFRAKISLLYTHTHTHTVLHSLSRLTRLSLPSSSVAISSRRRVVKFPVRRIVRTSTLGTLWDRGGTRVPRILKSQSTLEKVATLSILVSLNYGGEGLSESWHEGNKMRSK